MNRRDLLKGLAAGGIIVAGELWIPGKKLISIPKPKVYIFGPGHYHRLFNTLQEALRHATPGDLLEIQKEGSSSRTVLINPTSTDPFSLPR